MDKNDVIFLDDITGNLGEIFSDDREFDVNVPMEVRLYLKKAYECACNALNDNNEIKN